MYQYWSVIEEEENCDMDLVIDEDHIELTMNKCPSLSKVMDNDAARMGAIATIARAGSAPSWTRRAIISSTT